jgi:hypothetical protein
MNSFQKGQTIAKLCISIKPTFQNKKLVWHKKGIQCLVSGDADDDIFTKKFSKAYWKANLIVYSTGQFRRFLPVCDGAGRGWGCQIMKIDHRRVLQSFQTKRDISLILSSSYLAATLPLWDEIGFQAIGCMLRTWKFKVPGRPTHQGARKYVIARICFSWLCYATLSL